MFTHCRPATWLVLIISFITFFLACKKDQLDSFDRSPAVENPSSEGTLSLSIDEAREYFDLVNTKSLMGTADTTQYHFVDINPMWQKAYLDASELGRPLVVVPINDTYFRSLNNGSTTATLLFSRISSDTILAELLISIADSAYYQRNNHQLNRTNYTGWFLFFDISKHFKYGINVVNGVPDGKITGLSMNSIDGGVSSQDRSDEDCIVEIDYGITVIPCPDQGMAVQECYKRNYIVVNICDDWGNSSGGSGGSTGGGSGGGGSTGGGGGFIPSQYNNPWAAYAQLIATGQLPYWAIWLYGIPVHIFEYYGGVVPTSTEVSLTQLNAKCNFSSEQLTWLQNHTSLLDLITSLLQDNNYSKETIDALKDVIDARIGGTNLFSWANMAKLIEVQTAMDLPKEQLEWLIENSKTPMTEKAVDVVYEFLKSKNYVSESVAIAKLMLELQIQDELPINGQSSVFQQTLNQNSEVLGPEPHGPSITLLWTICYEIEKARLRYDDLNAGKYSGDYGEWKLAFDAAWNVSIEGVHILLDGIGLVPVVGEVADLTNGFLYVMEGDWANGTLAVASSGPFFLGWTATAAKYAQKIKNINGRTCKLIWLIDDAGEIVFGNRNQLARIIKPAENQVAHHIIPIEHATHDVVQLAAKNLDNNPWHMNEAINGLAIDSWRHMGGHHNFNIAMRQKLDQISELPGLSSDLARAKCEYLANQTRAILNQNPTLTVNDPYIANLILQIQF